MFYVSNATQKEHQCEGFSLKN